MEEEIKNKKMLNILKWTIVGILSFAIAVLSFGVGVRVGEERAQFSFRWAEDYHRNFGGPDSGIFGNMPGNEFMSGHGIFGSIIKIDEKTLIIKDKDNTEKTVVILDNTTIVDKINTVKLSDLKIDDNVVIIGSPNQQGEIEAKFIRLLQTLNQNSESFAPQKNNLETTFNN
jgi:hypothetical protein